MDGAVRWSCAIVASALSACASTEECPGGAIAVEIALADVAATARVDLELRRTQATRAKSFSIGEAWSDGRATLEITGVASDGEPALLVARAFDREDVEVARAAARVSPDPNACVPIALTLQATPQAACAGAVIHVSPSGADTNDGLAPDRALKTIARAIALGATCVRLSPGEHREDLTIGGEGALTIFGPKTAVLRGVSNLRVASIHRSNVTLAGFTIDGQSDAADVSASFREKLIQVGGAVVDQRVRGVVIDGMTLRNARKDCVRLRYLAEDVSVRFNAISACGLDTYRFGGDAHDGEGVYVGTGLTARDANPSPVIDASSRAQVIGNEISEVSECVDVKEGAVDALVADNVCRDALDEDSGAIHLRADRGRAEWNFVHRAAGSGVRVGGTDEGGAKNGVSATVEANVVRSTKVGVQLEIGPPLRVCGQRLYDVKDAIEGDAKEELDPVAPCGG